MSPAQGLGGTFLVLTILATLCYFLPTIVAGLRRHRQFLAICAVNLFFGWTVAGWFIAFIWSLTSSDAANQTVIVNTAVSTGAERSTPVTEPVRIVEPMPRTLPPPPAPLPALRSRSADDEDTAFWDGLLDKNDPDCLEEYLIRYPHGRFSELARRRLERHGIVPSAPPALAAPQPSCLRCDAPLETGSRFCTACGAVAA